jgi:hypothetical protein
MGFDCFRSGANNNTILRLDPIESDSLVNDQNLSEIATYSKRDAGFTN